MRQRNVRKNTTYDKLNILKSFPRGISAPTLRANFPNINHTHKVHSTLMFSRWLYEFFTISTRDRSNKRVNATLMDNNCQLIHLILRFLLGRAKIFEICTKLTTFALREYDRRLIYKIILKFWLGPAKIFVISEKLSTFKLRQSSCQLVYKTILKFPRNCPKLKSCKYVSIRTGNLPLRSVNSSTRAND